MRFGLDLYRKPHYLAKPYQVQSAVKRYRNTITVGLTILAILAAIWGLIALDIVFGWTEYGAVRNPCFPGEEIEISWGKTIWDWLNLLIVPVVLAVGGLLFNRAERRAEQKIAQEHIEAEREIAASRAREASLQSYLDKMTELLLENRLRESETGSEVQIIARARTLTALRSLDSDRKGILVQFLYESSLIRDKLIVELRDGDLRGANLAGANLQGALLRGTDLEKADLQFADLQNADLRGVDLANSDLSLARLQEADLLYANLQGANLLSAHLMDAVLQNTGLQGTNLGLADLRKANLEGADLRTASLLRADLRGANLAGANLEGAVLRFAQYSQCTILPDSTKWTPHTDMERFLDRDNPEFWQPPGLWTPESVTTPP